MTHEDILKNLCYYDERNPNNTLDAYDDDDKPKSNPDCWCDNCYQGRTKLADELLMAAAERDCAMAELTAIKAYIKQETDAMCKRMWEERPL